MRCRVFTSQRWTVPRRLPMARLAPSVTAKATPLVITQSLPWAAHRMGRRDFTSQRWTLPLAADGEGGAIVTEGDAPDTPAR